MIKVTQYRPAFFEGFENHIVEVDSKDELLDIEFVKGFKENPDFHRYSLSTNKLMAEYKNGEEWWVVAFLENYEGIDLPQWQAGNKTR